MALKTLIVPAKQAHTATVIFSHGLGDTGHGWSFLADQLAGVFPHVKFCFPHAPMRPITINFGQKMPGWFDIKSLRPPMPGNPRDDEDEEGLWASVKSIQSLVEEEVKAGIKEERIVVGGFSQGAAISLLTGLTSERNLAGVVCLSGWLPMDHKATSFRKPNTKDFKVFFGHGRADQVVQFPWGESSYKLLKEKLEMPNVEFHAYKDLPHSANEQELEDLARFLKQIVP